MVLTICERTKKMTQQIEAAETIKTKKYQWSRYSFIVNAVSFTVLTGLIVILMIMHRMQDPTITFKNWVIIVVGISCEIAFLVGSYLDAKRRDPKERMFGSSIFNLPVFALGTIIVCLIYWGQPTQLTVTYGALIGGFAGYLSGALAYGSFFVRIENVIYRIIFGGWIAIPLGAILGAIIAGSIDPLGGLVFGGVFWGFWGGTISGVPAVLALYYLRNDTKYTSFFVKLQYYDIQKEFRNDLETRFNDDPKELNLEDCKFFQEPVKKSREKLTDFGSKALIVLFAMNFMLGLLVLTGPKIIRGLLFFMNPWEERDEKRIRKSFYEIIDSVTEPLGLIRENMVIKISE